MRDPWPVTLTDVRAAARRIVPFVHRTPLRSHPLLDAALGHGISVLLKHENFQVTQSYKARNGASALTALGADARSKGIVAATRGNHGLGLAHAGRLLGTKVTICVPRGNSPAKNGAMRALGATLVEEADDYDGAAAIATELCAKGATLVHSTNDARVIAGAGTIALEMLEEAPHLDALVVAVGGGSQAVGTLAVVRELAPNIPVFAVQAAAASAIHDSWHSGIPSTSSTARTFADGLATRSTYPFTFPALCAGLAGFVTVTEDELAEAVRVLFETTRSVAEGAGAAGLAGLIRLAPQLATKSVGIILSGGNVDRAVLRTILAGGTPAV